MLIFFVTDPENDSIDGTASILGVADAWDKFCAINGVVGESSKAAYTLMAKRTMYRSASVDVEIAILGDILQNEKTSDFISVRDALNDLLTHAKADGSVDTRVIRRAETAMNHIFGGPEA